jgi:tetratricopeptide (TPR) repeat protein
VGPVAFSPDGRLLVSCGYDDVAMVWDAHTGEQVTPPLAHADDVLCAAFSPDGTRLATGGVDSVVRIWRLSTTDISLDDQLLLSRALSGRQVDETGGFRRLRPDELKEVWSRLRARHPRALEPEPHDALAWHSRQALACESQADWAGAAAHLRAVLELRPGDLLLEERMAGSLASAGRFAEAAAAFASVVKLSPTDSQAHLYLALTRWAAGDLNGYREACAQMVERFGGKEDVATRTYLTWACAVGPQAGVDLGAVIQAAEALVAAFPRDHNHANTLAVLLYRAGRLDDALKQFEVCFRIEADGNIWDWLFLAMLHQRLGRPEEAGRWLDKARAWSEVQLVDGPVGDPRLDWPHTAMARMFLREAEEIVKGR